MLKNNYVEYEIETGEIVGTVVSNYTPEPSSELTAIAKVDSLVDNENQYIDPTTHGLVSKKQFTLPSTVINGEFSMAVPTGTTVLWYGELYKILDGTLDLVVDEVGKIPLRLSHPQYKTMEVSLENS